VIKKCKKGFNKNENRGWKVLFFENLNREGRWQFKHKGLKIAFLWKFIE